MNRLPAKLEALPRTTAGVTVGIMAALIDRDGNAAAPPGPRVHAGARRGQHVDPRHRSAQHFAGAACRRSPRRPGPSWPHIPKSNRSSISSAARTTRTDTDGYYNSEYFVPLRPEKEWPKVVKETGWRDGSSAGRAPAPRTKSGRRDEAELDESCPASTGTSRRISATT